MGRNSDYLEALEEREKKLKEAKRLIKEEEESERRVKEEIGRPYIFWPFYDD